MNQRAIGEAMARVIDALGRDRDQTSAGWRNPRLRERGTSRAGNQRYGNRRHERDAWPHGLAGARLRCASNALSTASRTVVALVGALMMNGYWRRASLSSVPSIM